MTFRYKWVLFFFLVQFIIWLFWRLNKKVAIFPNASDNIIQHIMKDFDRKVFFVYGGTDTDTREKIRAITEKETDAIIVASYGTFSTGINIRNLHNVVFSSPSKSRIRVLQSIGRGLRTSKDNSTTRLYDIADDLTHNGRPNYTLSHFQDRINIYNEEQFNYEIDRIKI